MRATILYSLAFLLILGAGVYFILPRLQGPGPAPEAHGDRTSTGGTRGAGPLPAYPSTDVDPVTPLVIEAAPAIPLLDAALTALPASFTVTVVGPTGALRGPLKPIVGAEITQQEGGGAAGHMLTLKPIAATVHFGAVGHQWVALSIGELQNGMTITLPKAAPTLVVRVHEADGSPAVDTPLRVSPKSPLGLRRTDAGGTLVLDDLPPGNVVIACTTHRRAGPTLRLRTGVDRELEVTLDPTWVVTGTVMSPGGNPVPGATISAFGPHGLLGVEIKTDAAGRFRWRGPLVGLASFRVWSALYAELAVEARPPTTGGRITDLGRIDFTAPGASVGVRVRASIPGALIVVQVEPRVAAVAREIYGAGQILGAPRRLEIRSGERAQFEGLPAGIPLRVSVRNAGVPVDAFVKPEPAQDVQIEVGPDAGHVVAGIVRDVQGKPVVGLRILLSATARDGDLRFADDIEVFTGVGGAFQVFGIPWRVAYLRAYPEGPQSLLRRIELPLEVALVLPLAPAPLDAAHRLSGRVRDDQGRLLPGVIIQAGGRSTQSDAKGRFQLDGIVTAGAQLRVAYGYEAGPVPEGAPHPRAFGGRAFVSVARWTGKELDLILARAVRLSFGVADAVDDTPLNFVHVVARGPDKRILLDRIVATRDGRVALPALSPFSAGTSHAPGIDPKRPIAQGGVGLFLCVPGRRYEAKIPVAPGEDQDLGVLLMKGGMRVRGVVKDADGRPLAGARVAGMDPGWRSRGSDREREREMLYRTTQADAEGRFVLQGFNPRRGADIVVWYEGYAPLKYNVLLPPFSDDVDVDLDVRLGEGATLLLVLEDGGSQRPVLGALMDIEYARDGGGYLDLLHFGAFAGPIGSTHEWQTASELLLFATREPGNYRLGPMRPGPYELWIEHPAYASEHTRLTLPSRGENIFDAITHRHSSVKAGRFEKRTISFMGNVLRILIPLSGR